MNKKAVILTQLIQQLKLLAIFIGFYVLFLIGATGIEKMTTLNVSFDGISYVLVMYLVVFTWMSFLTNITLYSYHSYSRKTILNRTVIVQLIISFISSLLIEAHNLLMTYIPFFSFIEPDDSVRVVYTNQLTSQEGLRYVLSIIFVTLVIFSVLLLTDLVLIATYSMRKRTVIIILFTLLVLILGALFSLPYWSKEMLSLMITVLGFVSGTGQSIVPSIVIPAILLVLVGVISYFISLKLVKKLEVHKSIFI
ncbi:MAG: hypothetical protein RR470_02980 [Vagococcus sp.]|uniref:hypothetical protein n=1 Tax=Vagococcus sp. TaxID=1933889 RepID=UPI002FC8D2F7